MVIYTVKVKNDSGESKTWCGKVYADQEEYQLSVAEMIQYSDNSTFFSDVGIGDALVGDGSQYFSDSVVGWNWLTGHSQPVDIDGNPIHYVPAFAFKTLSDGSKLFKRLHGTIESLTTGSNNVIFVCPHGHVKMIGARIVGAEIGDYCSFYVLDDENGTYFGTPNAVLNQYGYNVAIAPDNHIETCKYDADLYYGMQIKFVYTSVSDKTVGFNFDMSEVVAPS